MKIKLTKKLTSIFDNDENRWGPNGSLTIVKALDWRVLSAPVVNKINFKFLDINDVRAALPKVTAQLESLSETVDDVASKTPSETLLVTLKTSTQKASEKIAAVLADISSNSAEIQNLKTSGEKGQSMFKNFCPERFYRFKEGSHFNL